MSLLFFDGFDQYSNGSDLVNYGGWSLLDTTTTLTTSPRVGTGKYLDCNLWTGTGLKYTFSSDQSGNTLYIGMAFKVTTLADNMPFLSISGQCTIYIVQSGANWKFEARRGTTVLATSSVITYSGTWVYLEFKVLVNTTTGIVELKIDNTTAFTFTGNTQNNGSASVTYILFPNHGNISGHYGLDDLYICNSTGSANNTYRGEQLAEFCIPSGDSTVAWAKNSGTFNYQAVDDPLGAPDDDTTYVYSNTSGQKDEYTLTDLSNVLSVVGVKLITRAEKDNTGALSLKTGIKSGATDQQVTHSLPIGYVNFIDIFETSDGAGTAFTATTVNSLLSTIQIP
jgi:hypothetical protein